MKIFTCIQNFVRIAPVITVITLMFSFAAEASQYKINLVTDDGIILIYEGESTGLKKGDILTIQSGDSLAPIGKAKVEQVMPQITKGKIIESEREIQEGDVASLETEKTEALEKEEEKPEKKKTTKIKEEKPAKETKPKKKIEEKIETGKSKKKEKPEPTSTKEKQKNPLLLRVGYFNCGDDCSGDVDLDPGVAYGLEYQIPVKDEMRTIGFLYTTMDMDDGTGFEDVKYYQVNFNNIWSSSRKDTRVEGNTLIGLYYGLGVGYGVIDIGAIEGENETSMDVNALAGYRSLNGLDIGALYIIDEKAYMFSLGYSF
ncbi:MAG: hypothetical protein AB1546_08475 [bacterium]